jgi:general secretion pathway protein M
MTSLSLPVRRFAAVAILAVMALLVWEFVMDPIAGLWNEAANANARSAHLLAAYRKAVDDQPQWAALSEKMRQAPYADAFTDTSDPDLAAGKLQQKAKQLTEAAQADIHSIQVLPASKDRDLQRAGVRISFSVPIAHLAEVLAKYDADRPYLYVDNLVITAPENSQSSAKTPPQVSVSCNLFSYLKPAVP